MSPITIPCPECGAQLKLPDRKALGKRGRCPKCSHRFVLTDPDEEVPLTVVEPQPKAAAPSSSAGPQVGVAARWVPDAPAEPGAPPVAPPQTSGHSGPQLPPAAPPLDFSTPAATPAPTAAIPAAPAAATSAAEPAAADLPAAAAPAAFEFQVPDADTATASVTKRIRRRPGRRRTGPALFGVVTAVFAFAMFGVWWFSDVTSDQTNVVTPAPPQANPEYEAQQQQHAASDADAEQLSPTSGDPIPLDYFAFTPHLIFHLHPDRLWSDTPPVSDFRAMLGVELSGWLEQQIESLTGFKPQEIDELTVAVNFGPRGSPADVGAVVRLQQPIANLNSRLGGQIRPVPPVTIFETESFSYMPVDDRTFAVAPVSMSEQLSAAKEYPAMALVDLQPLLEQSDRQRDVTLIFDIQNIDVHREDIFIEQLQPLADQFVLWFGKDVQTVSWSLQLDNQLFFMETLLHQSNESSPLRVRRFVDDRLSKLPEQIYAAVRRMRPAHPAARTVIGRFPAMLAAATLGTTSHVGSNYVRLITMLPEPAAANLAAGVTLTWNQSLVTDFSEAPPQQQPTQTLPDTVAERLQMPVLIDFRRTPLQDAFQYISEEIQTPIRIIGEDLELAGITQVMAQTFNLGEVPAIQGIDAILKQYEGVLVISVDETEKTITLTTRPQAEAKGLPIYETSGSP